MLKKIKLSIKYSMSTDSQLSNGGMRMTRIKKLNCLAALMVLVALIAAPAVQAQSIADAKTKIEAIA